MRGVVSAGMTAALEQLGLRDAFDEVHGSSAGAFNATFFLAGQAGYLTTLYQHGFGDPRFVSFRRVLRGGHAFDMDYVITKVWTRQRPLRFDVIFSSGIELHCTATDADRAEIVDLTELERAEDIQAALRASARLPWLAGPPVEFRGRRLLDATLAEAIPVHAARGRPPLTCWCCRRDRTASRTRPCRAWIARLTDRYLQRINPALVELRRTAPERYDQLSGELAAAGRRDRPHATVRRVASSARLPARLLIGPDGEPGGPALHRRQSAGCARRGWPWRGGPGTAGDAPRVLTWPCRPVGRPAAGRRVGLDGEPSGAVAGRLHVLTLGEAALLVLLGSSSGSSSWPFEKRPCSSFSGSSSGGRSSCPSLKRRPPRPRGTPQAKLRPPQTPPEAAPALPCSLGSIGIRPPFPFDGGERELTAPGPPHANESVTVVTHGGTSGGVAVTDASAPGSRRVPERGQVRPKRDGAARPRPRSDLPWARSALGPCGARELHALCAESRDGLLRGPARDRPGEARAPSRGR